MRTTRRELFQISIFGATFGLTASELAAAEVWQSKPASEWSEKDIEKLMNKSPWAKKFAVDTGRGPAAFAGPEGRGGGGGGRGGAGPQGGVGNPDDIPPGGPGGGAPGGGGGAPEALVRWESALPILEAQKRQLPDAFKGAYAISVSGFPVGRGPGGPGGAPPPGNGAPGGGLPGGAGGPGGFDPQAMRAAQQQMFERARETTQLERKGKDPIHPAIISLNGRSLVLLFPQGTQPIQLEDKDVTLVLKLGLPEMKAKFSLKEMVYNGKLEL